MAGSVMKGWGVVLGGKCTRPLIAGEPLVIGERLLVSLGVGDATELDDKIQPSVCRLYVPRGLSEGSGIIRASPAAWASPFGPVLPSDAPSTLRIVPSSSPAPRRTISRESRQRS